MINNHTGIRKTEGFCGFRAELATKALNYAGLAKMAPGAARWHRLGGSAITRDRGAQPSGAAYRQRGATSAKLGEIPPE